VPAVHTEALAGRGETWRWMSAAAGALGDRVLASITESQITLDQVVINIYTSPVKCSHCTL